MTSDSQAFRHGIELFNAGEFYEAHEVLEDVWRAATGERKKFLQALVQVAVGLHHHSKGNLVGAQSVLTRAEKNLDSLPDDYEGVKIGTIRASLSEWISALQNGKSITPAPRI